MFAFTDDRDIDSQISIIPIDANLDFLFFNSSSLYPTLTLIHVFAINWPIPQITFVVVLKEEKKSFGE